MLDIVVSPISRFFVWWGRELAGMVPGAWRTTRGGRGARTVVSLDRSRIEIIEERGRTSRVLASTVLASTEGGGVAEPGEALALLDAIDVREPVGLRVPLQACFSRSLSIPAAAESDAAVLAALDLERATPFRAADVLTAVLVDPNAEPVRGRLAIRQLVLKRDTVRQALAAIEARGLGVSFIDCWSDDRKSALPVNFLKVESTKFEPAARRRVVLNRALAAAAAAGAVAALAMIVVKQDNALAVLELETKAARAAASEVGQRLARSEAAVAQVAKLRQLRGSRPLAIELLDEVTRLLPDGAYLTELSLDGDQLDISGFATSAAPLLEVFERSRLFADARFSAPSRLEPREDRERFSLRVRLRASQSSAGTPNISPKG